MLGYLILLFTVVPLVELALLIKVGQYIGVLNTVSLVVITGVVGAIMARSQGISVLMKVQQDLQDGVMPTERLFDGMLILVAGILLITPGIATDGIGFFLLIPYGRHLIKLLLKRVFSRHIQLNVNRRGDVFDV